MKLKNNEISQIIISNAKHLIDKKIIKTEKDLYDPTLTQIEQIADELNICVKDILCCYCTYDKCIEGCR